MEYNNDTEQGNGNDFNTGATDTRFKIDSDTLNNFSFETLKTFLKSKSFWMWVTIGTLAILGFGLMINGFMCLFTGKVKSFFTRMMLGGLVFGIAAYWCLGILIKKGWNYIDKKYEGSKRVVLKVVLICGVFIVIGGISFASSQLQQMSAKAAHTAKTEGKKPPSQDIIEEPKNTVTDTTVTPSETEQPKTTEKPTEAEPEIVFETPLGNNPIMKDPLNNKDKFLIVLQCVGKSFVDFTMDGDSLNK